jgi:hypothetical protein
VLIAIWMQQHFQLLGTLNRNLRGLKSLVNRLCLIKRANTRVLFHESASFRLSGINLHTLVDCLLEEGRLLLHESHLLKLNRPFLTLISTLRATLGQHPSVSCLELRWLSVASRANEVDCTRTSLAQRNSHFYDS